MTKRITLRLAPPSLKDIYAALIFAADRAPLEKRGEKQPATRKLK